MSSKKRRYLSREDYKSILEDMQESYPGLFSPNKTKLFKVGIIRELIANNDKYTATKLRGFARLYCNQKLYKDQHVLGATRYGLDGEVCGEVTAEQLASMPKSCKIHAAKKEAGKKQ